MKPFILLLALGGLSSCGTLQDMAMNTGWDSACTDAKARIHECCPKFATGMISCMTTAPSQTGSSSGPTLAAGQSRCFQERSCVQIQLAVRARDELCGYEFNHAKACNDDDPRQPTRPSEVGDGD
jgi:hypothetical protein